MQKKHLIAYAATALIALGIGSAGGSGDSSLAAEPAPKVTVSSSAGARPGVTVTATPTVTVTKTAAPALPETAMAGDGTYEVGVDVKPGTYVSATGDSGNCYWERSKGMDSTASSRTTTPRVRPSSPSRSRTSFSRAAAAATGRGADTGRRPARRGCRAPAPKRLHQGRSRFDDSISSMLQTRSLRAGRPGRRPVDGVLEVRELLLTSRSPRSIGSACVGHRSTTISAPVRRTATVTSCGPHASPQRSHTVASTVATRDSSANTAATGRNSNMTR